MINAIRLLTFGLILNCAPTIADDTYVNALLNGDRPPEGVVFEIIESKGSDLGWAFRQIKGYADALKAKFPPLDIAVVSHGAEQFGLLSENQEALPEVHELAKSFDKSGIEVHVCAVNASWRNKVPEDFPSYIDVADTGPAQIRRYEELGYEVIVIRESSAN